MTEPAHNGKLAKALLAAQKEMPAVEPDGVNPHYKSRFVTLGHLLAKTRPVLNKHGIAVSQLPSRAEDGSPTLTTVLMHESGESLSEVAPLLLSKQDPQGQGSAITYMRRYALASALGISDQEDDDGNAASPHPGDVPDRPAEPNMPSDKQLDFIASLAKKLGADGSDQDLLRAYASREFSKAEGGAAINALKGESDGLDAADALVRFVQKAAAWAEKQPDVAVDTEGLPTGESA